MTTQLNKIKRLSQSATFKSLRSVKFLVTFLAIFLLAACQQSNSQQNNDQKDLDASKSESVVIEKDNANPVPVVEEKLPVKNTFPFKGTVKYIPLEGGFFGIITDKGVKFLPLGLPKEYLQDGAEIEFSGMVKKDVMTIQQWGTPFTIKDIKLIKPGNPVNSGTSRNDI